MLLTFPAKKFGAALRVASIANSGGSDTEGESICVKDSAEVEVKMLVEDKVSKKTKGPSFHWVGGCTPFVGGGTKNIKATWVGEAEILEFVVGVGSRVDIRERSGGEVYVWSIVGTSEGCNRP